MPELPELEVIQEVLTRRVLHRPISDVWVSGRGGPIILRTLVDAPFQNSVEGQQFQSVARRGKFLIFNLQPSGLQMVINPKLTGRLKLGEPSLGRTGHTHVVITLSEPDGELRYLDSKRMGQIYLCADLSAIPRFSDQGPEPLQISQPEFIDRIRSFRGEIKGVLTRGQLVAGIGNAYADEILWEARIHPFRKRTDLDQQEILALHKAMQRTLSTAIEQVRQEMGEDIDLKPRDFFAVHLKHEHSCPRCGGSISSVTARNRITNFCRTCQPGGLIRGMAEPRS